MWTFILPVLASISWMTAPCIAISFSNQTDILTLSRAVSLFSQDVYREIGKPDVNLIYSPLATHAILSMIYAGARGETAVSMANTLKLTDLPSPHNAYHDLLESFYSQNEVIPRVINGLWTSQYSIEQNYNEIVSGLYLSVVKTISQYENGTLAPFSESSVNTWVTDKSSGKIKSFLAKGEDIRPDTSLLLINSMLFTAPWLYPFDVLKTITERFYLSDRSYVDIPFMVQTESYHIKLSAFGKVDVIRIPFRNERFALYIAVPILNVQLDDLEANITAGNLDVNELFTGLVVTRAVLKLPKFNIRTKLYLNRTLNNLGMSVAFQGNADFTGISRNHVQISNGIQTIVLVVKEYGVNPLRSNTEVPIFGPLDISPLPEFKVDQRFLFFIRDDDNELVLVRGKLTNPTIPETIVV